MCVSKYSSASIVLEETSPRTLKQTEKVNEDVSTDSTKEEGTTNSPFISTTNMQSSSAIITGNTNYQSYYAVAHTSLLGEYLKYDS